MAHAVELSAESMAILGRLVEDGKFNSIDDALEHAVLQFQDMPSTQELEDAARPALEQMKRGEGVPHSEELLTKIFADARRRAEQSRRISHAGGPSGTVLCT